MAVALVAWSHWERPYQFGLPFGAGVHLFYVLSGFLITGILLRLRDVPARGHAIGMFYARRTLRIVPAFYLTLALAALAGAPFVRDTWAWHAAYLSNVWIYVSGQWPGAISHFWSLAVEEQFYLAWPWLIVFAPARLLLPGIVASIAAAPFVRWGLSAMGERESFLALLTPGCLDSLGMGALVALWSATRPDERRRQVFRGWLLAIGAAGWLPLLAAGWVSAPVPAWALASKQTFQAMVFAWLVLRAADGFTGRAGAIMSSRPLLYLGRISYGLYLIHGFAGDLLRGLLAMTGFGGLTLREPWRFLLLATVTTALAAASWHLYEAPLNRLKQRLPYERDPKAPEPERRPSSTFRPMVSRPRVSAAARCESPRP